MKDNRPLLSRSGRPSPGNHQAQLSILSGDFNFYSYPDWYNLYSSGSLSKRGEFWPKIPLLE